MDYMKKIVSALLCVSLTPVAVMAEENVKYIYVSPTGDDSAAQAEGDDVTVKSLEGAKKRFLYLKEKNKNIKSFEIVFDGGEYTFDKSVTFEKGEVEGVNLTIRSKKGERVEFNGSKKIPKTAFERVSDVPGLNLKVQDKIYCASLESVGITKAEIGTIPDEDLSSYYDNILYSDGKKQQIAEYPNGRYAYTSFEKCGADKRSFYYTEDRLSQAAASPDAYVSGYLTYDYVCSKKRIKSIDPNKKLMTVSGSVVSSQSKRFKVLNALSELDIPGEYYIDRENMLLYYYPKGEIGDCELSVMNDYLIKLVGASNVTIDGITFTKTRNGAISATHEQIKNAGKDNIPQGSDNCVVKNCSFNNMGGYSIYIGGYIITDFFRRDYAPFDSQNPYATETYTNDRHGGGKNWKITDNLFYSLDDTSIAIMSGGNPYILEKSNNLIENNYFTQIALEFPSNSVLTARGIGVKIKNNLFHNMSGQVVVHNGFEHEISYNEFSNAIKDVQDAGVIYAGRNIIRRGAEISYNLIRDFLPAGQCMQPHSRAIYYDDEMCGQSAHHNLIADGDKGITYSGSSGDIYANVCVDTISGLDLQPYGGTWTNTQKNKYLYWINGKESTVYNDMPEETYELWNKTYPNLRKEYNFWQESINSGTEVVEGMFVNVKDNLTVGSKNTIFDKYTERGGTVENNTLTASFSDFVDYENYDLRIKKNSETASTNTSLLTEDFDINSIGIQNQSIISKAMKNCSFELLYPENNQTVTEDEITFVWENAVGADKYKFEISKDKDFTERVFEIETYSNSQTVRGLSQSVDKYYWRVTAINETREMKAQWQAEVLYSFSTSQSVEMTKCNGYISVKYPKSFTDVTLTVDKGELTQEKLDNNEIKVSGTQTDAKLTATYKNNGKTYVKSFDLARLDNMEAESITEDLSKGSTNWKRNTPSSAISGSMNSLSTKVTIEDNAIKLQANSLYTSSSHKTSNDGEFEMKLKTNNDYLRAMLQGVRASDFKAKDTDESLLGVKNLLYMKGYAIAHVWGNVQLLKLDGNMSLNDATDYAKNTSAILARSSYSVEKGKEYKTKITTQNLSDGGVKIQYYICKADEYFTAPILSYVDRTNPYLSGQNVFATQGIESGDYYFDDIKTKSYLSSAGFDLTDIKEDYGFKIVNAEGTEFNSSFENDIKQYDLKNLENQKVKIELYDFNAEGTIIAALYENGALKVTSFFDENKTTELKVPTLEENNKYELKIFVWSDLVKLLPIYNSLKASM